MAFNINEPEEGYYRRRLVSGGPWVPARIFWEYGEFLDGMQVSDDRLWCIVNNEYRDPWKEWPWIGGQPITEAEYKFMVDDALHARAHRPNDAKTTPDKPIDIGKMDPIF